jgi:hypothetical protein
MRVTSIALVVVIVLADLAFSVAPASAGQPRVIVVDDDQVQCPAADYTQLQPAVNAARPGDTVQVCDGSYLGDVTVPAGVILAAQTPAAPSIDCIAGGAAAQGTATVTGGVTLSGNGATLDGLIVTGADTGITTSVDASGYNIRRNVVQSNGNFGVDLRSPGGQPTLVEQNCIRNNGVIGIPGMRAGLIGDFADVRNATIRSNTFVDNVEAISLSGLMSYSNISITRNVIRRDVGIVAAGLVGSEISGNDIDFTGAASANLAVILAGGNTRLTISTNTVTAAIAGLYFCLNCTNDNHSDPNTDLLISDNTIRNDVGSGITMAAFDPSAPVVLTRSVIQRNTIVDNGTSGIFLNPGSVDNRLLANTSSRNLRGVLLSGATGTTVLANALTENRQIDARDILPDQNTWLGNRCATDDPAGVLCVPPGDRSH